MSFRTTLLLLLVLAGLGGYAYWVEYPKAQEEAKPRKLYDFKADDVSAVTLTYADREIEIEKSGDDWRLLNLITVARLIAHAAYRREESRGGHFRSDFPERDDLRWRFHAVDAPDPVK